MSDYLIKTDADFEDRDVEEAMAWMRLVITKTYGADCAAGTTFVVAEETGSNYTVSVIPVVPCGPDQVEKDYACIEGALRTMSGEAFGLGNECRLKGERWRKIRRLFGVPKLVRWDSAAALSRPRAYVMREEYQVAALLGGWASVLLFPEVMFAGVSEAQSIAA